MKRFVMVAALAAAVLAGSMANGQDSNVQQRARELSKRVLITDGHIDLPYRLEHKWEDVSVRTENGEFDFIRAREGGLDAPFMSIFTPASLEREGKSKILAEELIDMVYKIAEAHPRQFAVTTSPDQAERNFDKGIISLCMGMENGSPIEDDLANVRHFYERGIRYITLTHSKDNHICDSSYDTTGTWQGMSEFGLDVAREMNRVGIMVDVSHISDQAFWQVMEVVTAPVIASHSSCRYFVPDFERNISDDMIRRVAENGGVVQINFGSTFISNEARLWADAYRAARTEFLEARGLETNSDEGKAFMAGYRAAKPFPFADVADVADHIEHVVEIAGIDHVGFGSDFDGVGNTLPTRLKDVAHYPGLIAELLERGMSEEDIEKIAYRNVFRVWREVERVAALDG